MTVNSKRYTLEQMQGPAPASWKVLLAVAGLLAIAVGTLLPILNVLVAQGVAGTWWKYVYAAGAVCFLAAKLLTPYKGEHPRIRRLYRIESWSAIFFCVAAFFLFYNGNVSRDSWAFTLAGGVLLVFTTIAIPRVVRRELKNQANQTTSGKK